MEVEEQLRQEFATNNFSLEDDDAAGKCASMCVSFALTPKNLVSQWELFYLNLQMDGGLVLNTDLENFHQFLEKERRESFRKKQTGLHFYTKDDIDMLLDDKQEEEWEDKPFPLTPLPTGAHASTQPSAYGDPADLTPPPPVARLPGFTPRTSADFVTPKLGETPFGRRPNKFTVQTVFNEPLPVESTNGNTDSVAEDDDVVKRLKPIARCQVEVMGTGPKPGCRYMCDRIEDRFNTLDRQVQNFAKVLEERLHCNVADHVAVASQERVMVVGRVCCEGEGRLNEKSVLLEGSVEHSNGQRVRLDLRNLPQFSFFPGQILGIEGQNPSGHCLLAARVFDCNPLPLASALPKQEGPPSKRSALEPHAESDRASQSSQEIRIMAAAGPFTTSDNLAYEPLLELLTYAQKCRPNLLVLMGPFVDLEHPQIKQGTVNKTFTHIFQEEIRMRVEEYCDEMGDGCRVVLIPSCRDAHHDCMFPQPPFNSEDFEDANRQITLLANPGVIKCNEITLGCCTVDVLRHLSSEEASRTPSGATSDRMTRLASHLLAQRSFYPLFPPAQGVVLDLSIAPGSLDLPCSPDLLLLPSNLAPFVKVLSLPLSSASDNLEQKESSGNAAASVSSICINPGHVARGISGGTFTEILIKPTPSSEPLESRTSVKVMRI